MHIHKTIIIASFVQFVSCAVLAQTAKDIVEREYIKVSANAGITSKITVTSSATNYSSPSSGIILSKKVLDYYKNQVSPNFFPSVIDFVIAHELAHQMQFKSYGDDMIKSASCEKKSLYECQADIISGAIFAKMNGFNDPQNLPESKLGALSSIFQFVYDIGDQEFALTTHPSHLQRRNAIRFGMTFAMASGKWPDSYNQNLIKGSDIKDGEQLLPWSLKTAKRIIHYPSSAAKNVDVIAMYNDKSVSVWDTSGNHPYLNYSNSFKNIGNKPLLIFAQYKIVGKNRLRPGDPRLIDRQGLSDNFSFTLQPNEVFLCKGSLNWKFLSDKELMPAEVFPPDNEALYNAEFLDDQLNVSVDDGCPVFAYNASSSAIPDQTIELALERANSASINNFDDLINGFATQTTQFLKYRSSYTFPDARGASVESLKRKKETIHYLSVDIYTGSSKIAAQQSFDKIRKKIFDYDKIIKQDLSDYSKLDPTDTSRSFKILPYNVLQTIDEDSETKEISGVFKDTKTKISLMFRNRYNRFTVGLTFHNSTINK